MNGLKVSNNGSHKVSFKFLLLIVLINSLSNCYFLNGKKSKEQRAKNFYLFIPAFLAQLTLLIMKFFCFQLKILSNRHSFVVLNIFALDILLFWRFIILDIYLLFWTFTCCFGHCFNVLIFF